jgi:hypothetical protein
VLASMMYVAAFFASALIVFAYHRYRVNEIRSHVWSLGRRYAIPKDKPHLFTFWVTFPREDQVLLCRSLVQRQNLADKIESVNDGERWAITFTTTMLALPEPFRDIVDAIHIACEQAGEPDSTVVCSASLPGSGTALILHAC